MEDAPTLPKVEAMPTAPLSPYGLQKLVAEQYMPDVHAAVTASRPSRPVTSTSSGRGRIRTSPYSGVISLFISAVCEGRQPTIYGDGEQTRDFTYVANVVDGVLRACHAPGVSGEVVNVATGSRVSLNQLFRTIRDLVGTRVEPMYAAAREGDVRDSQADIKKARRLLGYEPTVSFDEGLAKTLEWYRASQTVVA